MNSILTTLLFGPLVALHAAGAPERMPNILLILTDDLGFSDLGCYGGEIETPNLDRLAAKGARFTQFYNTAKCHSSRVSLLSGRWCRQAGDTSLRRAVKQWHDMTAKILQANATERVPVAETATVQRHREWSNYDSDDGNTSSRERAGSGQRKDKGAK